MKKNRYKIAAALSYDEQGEDAPILSASGTFDAADQIVRIAHRYGIPVVEKPEMARTLSLLELGQQIPARLFHAVAEILNELELRVRSIISARPKG